MKFPVFFLMPPPANRQLLSLTRYTIFYILPLPSGLPIQNVLALSPSRKAFPMNNREPMDHKPEAFSPFHASDPAWVLRRAAPLYMDEGHG